MLGKINETATFLKQKISSKPKTGIILGTGLGGLVKKIEIEKSINYKNIPNFPFSTVDGHSGNLIFGKLNRKPVVAMQGRFHYYEGYSMQEVIFPVRVMKFLGVEHLIVSNASGGINPEFSVGEIMIIEDHINLMPNPLIGANLDELGPRFPDMSEPYDLSMIEKAEQLAKKLKIKIHKGCYLGTTGPTFETPKEYKYFRIIGGDAVGMSTVPEIIAAHHMGITCFAISIIADLGIAGKIKKITHKEVQQTAAKTEPQITQLVSELIATF